MNWYKGKSIKCNHFIKIGMESSPRIVDQYKIIPEEKFDEKAME